MKPFTVNTKSLHYRLASVYGPLCSYTSSTDICSYTRSVFWGTIVTLIIIIVGSCFAVLIGMPFSWIAAMITVNAWIEPFGPELIGLLVICFLTTFAVSTLYGRKIKAVCRNAFKIKEFDEPEEPGFVVQAYRSFKEKYCIPIEIVKN